jgi:hypothetical protein
MVLTLAFLFENQFLENKKNGIKFRSYKQLLDITKILKFVIKFVYPLKIRRRFNNGGNKLRGNMVGFASIYFTSTIFYIASRRALFSIKVYVNLGHKYNHFTRQVFSENNFIVKIFHLQYIYDFYIYIKTL